MFPELTQLGLKSRSYSPGPYSDREDLPLFVRPAMKASRRVGSSETRPTNDYGWWASFHSNHPTLACSLVDPWGRGRISWNMVAWTGRSDSRRSR